MVKALHAAGIEVILDVVYNHTAEGDRTGPTLSLARPRQRGLLPARRGEPRALRRLHRLRQHPRPAPPAGAAGWSRLPALLGTRCTSTASGSTWPPRWPRGDGRRSTAPRVLRRACTRTRCCRRVKLIAEPWDVGPGGYQARQLPAAVGGVERPLPRRRARRSGAATRGQASRDAGATGSTGSADLFRLRRPRGPSPSVNFVTAHDGFTLHDLVTYEHKHNEANGEDNRDGTDDNQRWNCGVEGPTDDPAVDRAARPADAQPAGHAAALDRACRCSPPATSWAAPRAATTTPTARTTSSPGSTGRSVDAGPARVRAPAAGAAPAAAGAAAGGVLRGRDRAARHRRHPRPGLVRPRRRAADHRGLVRHRAADGRHVPRRPRASGTAMPSGRPVVDDSLPGLAARRRGRR